ncbi:carboxylesterase/lipase family protein [Pontibacter sp. CAU 1760]
MQYTKLIFMLLLLATISAPAVAQKQSKTTGKLTANQVKTANGVLEGTASTNGIRTFKGIAFAAPPVGDLRWKTPQPVKSWEGVRPAKEFGPRAMQLPIFGDMNFRSKTVSEDCLYLNVWTPAKTGQERLPVLVYFYGGGFMAGDGSEPRYDGESMATKGIVAITVNYRLGVFGFMAHPELTKESPHNASGNYGLHDQSAALHWVKQNIAAFGGDPNKITIAGESAGSYSVSAQMASPLSRNLIAGAIGESGSLLSLQPTTPLEQAEQIGVKFANSIGANSLAALRAIPAQQLLEAAGKPEAPRFSAIVDGYFFPKAPIAIFEAGEQAQVPLLAGWNSEEMNYRYLLGQEEPTPENYRKAVERTYADKATEVLKLYPAATNEEVMQSATDLAGDLFIGYSTWKLIDLHSKTGNKPVYRYMYDRPRPEMTPEMGNSQAGLAGGVVRDSTAPKAPAARGAVHSAEIEYAMGNLASNKVYSWKPEDYKISEVMQNYFANFIKKGDPNGANLPKWPAVQSSDKAVPVMHIDVNTRLEEDKTRDRYLLLDKLSKK